MFIIRSKSKSGKQTTTVNPAGYTGYESEILQYLRKGGTPAGRGASIAAAPKSTKATVTRGAGNPLVNAFKRATAPMPRAKGNNR